MATSKPQPPDGAPEDPSQRLDSWKEIAAYLKRDERTVRRWEAEGMPVHRKLHKRLASVYAYRAEIDSWWHEGRQRLESQPPVGHRRLRKALLLALVALAILTAFSMPAVRKRLQGNAAIQSVAVLPLENLSNDSEQDYFADGITEELTTELAQISALKVISHTSVVQYKKTKKSMPQIARELGVDAVVEGAVERSGDKVGINVQLIYAPSDRHLWAKSYQRDLRNVLELQREVANAIVDGIKAKLTTSEKTRLSTTQSIDSAPYDNYLKGQFLLEKGEVGQSIPYFQRTIQDNPNYALAYAGLANAYISLAQPWYVDRAPNAVLPQAKQAAERALQIDDQLGDAHLAMARVIQLYEWDWAAVEKEYTKALQLNQNNSLACAEFGEFLQEMGRTSEALAQFQRATELDPLASGPLVGLGDVFYTARRYSEAVATFQRALAVDPDSVDAHLGLGWTYEQQKMYQQAIAELQRAAALSNDSDVPLASLGQVLAESGNRQEAKNILMELKRRSQHRYISPCLIALVQIGLDERDHALASLERGYAARDQWMLYLKVDPHMDHLRSDSRFKALLQRVGLSE